MNDSQQPTAKIRTQEPDDGLEPIELVGYPRKGDPRRVRRLYMTPKSETYVEIKVADIVDPPSESDGLKPGQIVIWVRGDANILLFEFPVAAFRARPPWPRRR